MFSRFFARAVLASILGLVGMTLGCEGRSPSGPTQPEIPATSVTPTKPAPSVTAITPNIGFTGGSASVAITGIGFQSGATVTLGGITVPGRFDSRDRDRTTIYLATPSHTAGTVDVVVTNPDGQSGTLTEAYTYASPESFDFNGNWEGGAQTGHVIFRLTIQDNTITTVSCDTSETVTFSPPPPVSNGIFSFSRDDGFRISGWFVSPSEAIGTINLAPCTGSDWTATKQ